MKNKTILLGLNELNFDYINFYINQGFTKFKKKIFDFRSPLETIFINFIIKLK